MTVLSCGLAAILVACLTAWLHALRRWAGGYPLLEATPRQPVPWGLVHLVGTVLLALLSQSSLVAVVIGTCVSG